MLLSVILVVTLPRMIKLRRRDEHFLTTILDRAKASLVDRLQPISEGLSGILMLMTIGTCCIRILLSSCQLDELVGQFVCIQLNLDALVDKAEVLFMICGDSKHTQQLSDASNFPAFLELSIE